MTSRRQIASWTCALLSLGIWTLASAHAATLHVWQDSPTPAPPYTNWDTAAHIIQDAVDATQAGDAVLVTNGVYSTGGLVVDGAMFNRVALTNGVRVESVNGPAVTIIEGAPAPGGGYGDGAIRCAYVADHALLSGFTLTNGFTRAGGDMLREQSGGGAYCTMLGVVSNCVFSANFANSYGGAACGGTLFNSSIVGNQAGFSAGGAYQATLQDCVLSGNSAPAGGGANGGVLYRCILSGNSVALDGGGAAGSRLVNCTLFDNSSAGTGGGVSGGYLYGCVLFENFATYGGGAYNARLFNCTVTGNKSDYSGGGVSKSWVFNSIIYHNAALIGSNHRDSSFDYSCTTPLPTNGVGNLDSDPQLASTTHLSLSSPCVGAGSFAYASDVDVDGELWANPPCMGADQLWPGEATGPLSVSLIGDGFEVTVGYSLSFHAAVVGKTTGCAWSFGDGVVVSNQAFLTHAWNTPGDYPLELRVFNDSHLSGVSTSMLVRVVAQPVNYVNRANPNPVPPYATWETAATNIQDAVAASQTWGRLVLVGDGVYDGGSGISQDGLANRAALTNGVILRSVNGPTLTIICGAESTNGGNGWGAIRGAYVGKGSVLDGFTLTNGHTHGPTLLGRNLIYDQDTIGGGLRCDIAGLISNCVVVSNSAVWGGGGAAGGTLLNCMFSNNASVKGGAAAYAALVSCELAGNSGGWGGGAYESTLSNCVLTSNSAYGDGGGMSYCAASDCVVTNNTSPRYAGGAYRSTLERCVLSGNTARDLGGGANDCSLSDCTLSGNWSGTYGGGASGGSLTNCILVANKAAQRGGGGSSNLLVGCVLRDNSAGYGGGAYAGTVIDCTLSGNIATNDGGGSYQCSLTNCIVGGNKAGRGGGSYSSAISNCTLTNNTATSSGGGVYLGSVYNSILSYNSTMGEGGGASEAGLYNCTLAGNQAAAAGGVRGSTVHNSIVYHNIAPYTPNHYSSSFYNSCTFPEPWSGANSFTNNPQLASASHLSLNSPCIGAGSSTYASGVDIDGQPWASPPCMGADQVVPGSATGPLSVAIVADRTQVALGFSTTVQAHIDGQTTGSQWDFGDGTIVSNQVAVTRTWTVPGTFLVRLTAFNDDHPEGVSSTVTILVIDTRVVYVNASNAAPAYPFATWETAATNIQEAIRICTAPGSVVLVTNGVYDTGGEAYQDTLNNFMTNRVSLTSNLVLRSVNGPAVTIIQGAPAPDGGYGAGAIRCVSLGSNSVLSGFTLTNGHASRGGGAYCLGGAVISNCVIIGNSADRGGGMEGGTAYQTTLTGNYAKVGGGAAYYSSLLGCELTGNTANLGGGVYYGYLESCRLVGNSATGYGGAAYQAKLWDCSLSNNIAKTGGAIYQGSANRCLLAFNIASDGGGASAANLTNCVLIGNASTNSGGGANGGVLVNCNLIGNASTNQGGGTSGGALINCNLTGNSSLAGGGAYGSTLRQCILTGNWATDSGGGAYRSFMMNCILTGNSATNKGGGVYGDHPAIVSTSTIIGNSADSGGGAYGDTLASGGTLINCIVYYNLATTNANATGGIMKHCCTFPAATGVGNFTNEPAFVNLAAGDLRLRFSSPCIDSGSNQTSVTTIDLEGNPRPLDGNTNGVAAFDIGAYEYNPQTADSNQDGIPDWWTLRFSLDPNDASVAGGNPDGDAQTTFEEWLADTDPTNALSALRVTSISAGPPVTVEFFSSPNRLYTMRYAIDLSGPWTTVPGQTDIPGTGSLDTLRDTNGAPTRYYRIGARLP